MSEIPLIPESAPFTAGQRLWLNGFLAGLFSRPEALPGFSSTDTQPQSLGPLTIVFGSQTGTAEGLARRFARQLSEKGFGAKVIDAAQARSVTWSAEETLLLICSTYGDGDMPDNTQPFWEWLQTAAAKSMAHLKFSVLALGDTNYEQFCAAGRKLDARLEELGATRLHPRLDCDVDYEANAKAWFEGALSALPAAPNSATNRRQTETVIAKHSSLAPAGETVQFSKSNPFPAALLANQRLTGDLSGKEVRHLALSLKGSDLEYEVGDALGVLPTNCPSLVGEFLHALSCDGEEAVPKPGGGEVSLRRALSQHYDITKPGLELLERVAECNARLRELLAPERKPELKQWLWGREVIDLFLETAGLSLSPVEFVRLLKPLAPRLYSISSSPKAHAGEVHLTVGIVRHESQGRNRKGVCSNFLAERTIAQATVPVFVQKSHGFKLPPDGHRPVIMVGPGTGVAPFRAFLHERQATRASGRNWLFFGEQRQATDFYYREELESMVRAGHLTNLSTAFSRDQPEKVYVQHRMLEHAAELWAWLQEGAHFYVCGDASRMAKDVDESLHRVIETAGGRTRTEAEEFVKIMKAEKRYQRDVY